MSKYRILTFDGGGIRGVLSARLLQRLSEIYPDLIPRANLFAGTSTGSFIALGLAYGLNTEDLINLYVKNGKYIFTPKHNVIFKPKYNNTHLKKLLTKTFPNNVKLKDLKKQVVIPSFLLDTPKGRWTPIFFNNFGGSEFLNEKVVDVALASSAAPVYFPAYNKYIDGGVIANNPSTAAISVAIDKCAGFNCLDDITLLSIGTGFNLTEITKDTQDWGFLEWQINTSPRFPLQTMLFDGVVEADAYFSSQLLKDRYFRLNTNLNKMVELDNYKEVDYLISLANELDLSGVISWIDKFWK